MKPDNWQKMLFEYLDECSKKEFSWGTFDCCTFACDWAIKMGHPDPMEKFRGKYKTYKGAMRFMLRNGKGAMKGLMHYCGDGKYKSVDPRRVQRGDVVAVSGIQVNEEEMMDLVMGVSVGDKVAIVSSKGLLYAKPDNIILAWRM